MKKYAIIVAAGTGSRMGQTIPKQFIELCGRPLLYYTMQTFLDAFPDISIVLVMHNDHFDRAREVIAQLSAPHNVMLVAGASSRYGSVKAGLAFTDNDSVVFVHDGVRCLLSAALVKRCYEAALEKGNAVPAISAVDSIRILKNDVNESIDRSLVKLVQTPQTFKATILKHAYNISDSENFTDDAAVAERAGCTIHLVDGEATNIKVTHPLDLVVAEKILEQKQQHCKDSSPR